MARSPLKSVLTLVTVGLGVGVLIFALSMSSTFKELMSRQLEEEGLIVTFANGEFNDEGEISPERPPQFDENLIPTVLAEIAGVEAVSPTVAPFWTQFIADGEAYRVRSVAGANETYAHIMGLELILGSFFTEADVKTGEKKAVISENLAQILFGSAENAIGEVVRPPAPENDEQQNQDGPGGAFRAMFMNPPAFSIVGVFADVGELRRKSYGVADMIIPYTSILPSGANATFMQRFLLSTAVIKVQGVPVETVEAQLREVLARSYGDELVLEVWEGTSRGQSTYLKELRQTIQTFSLVVNLLGFILLAAASIGILSIMLVEALGRSREIALERAIGASKGTIIREFFARSIIVSFISAVIGVVLSFVLSGPMTSLVLPIFEGVSISDIAGSVINAQSMLIGVVTALDIGGVFGMFPILSVLNVGISDALREA